MFVEAEASMNKYEVDGQARTALNLVARKSDTVCATAVCGAKVKNRKLRSAQPAPSRER